MSPRYFKSFDAIWKFLPDGTGFIRLHDGNDGWHDSICGIEDMDGKEEISAEEGEIQSITNPQTD